MRVAFVLFRAARRLRDRRRTAALRRRIMAMDWSWRSPAADYLRLYEPLVDRPRP